MVAYVGNNPYVFPEAWWKASSLIFGVGEVVEATGVEGLLEMFEVESLEPSVLPPGRPVGGRPPIAKPTHQSHCSLEARCFPSSPKGALVPKAQCLKPRLEWKDAY